MSEPSLYDVIVVGGGNAGLCAAVTAAEAGARVLVLECAPPELRGGNSRHTRNMRCAHKGPTPVLPGAYSEDEYFEDLLRVTEGRTDERLARMMIHASTGCPDWLMQRGMRFQPAIRGTLQLGRTNAFFLGGGKALLNSHYATAKSLGVRVLYNAEVIDLEVRDRCRVESIAVRVADGTRSIRTRAAVLASGGFEANLEWLKEIWGEAAGQFVVRGTPYNTGTILKLMLERGAQCVGDLKDCHAVAVDARAPRFDGGIVTRLDCIPLGIVVNKFGERFYDEGEDLWPKRYAIWGRLVAQQPDQIAFAIFDSKIMGRFVPSMFPPLMASSLDELALSIGVTGEALTSTVARYNRAVQQGTYDPSRLDDCRTEGLTTRKSHWALPIDAAPFFAYPLRPGITFTFLGLKVDERARIMMSDGIAVQNLYAAGEIMAGNLLGKGYIGGIGMTIGTVFGRIAGTEAAQHASH